jgi:hypothetical protein
MKARSYWLVFAASAFVLGFAFWWQADWFAYVDYPEGPLREFELPWWVQLPVSAAVGCFGGGAVVGTFALVRWAVVGTIALVRWALVRRKTRV